ncbi:MAG TPA: PD-(D/E)XK nuclease family protein [Candidatus Limiplasma sp.]|nr:PD-(D/E)XK nuclease family protein [Candidatus Limiplasma sp.]
MGNIRVLTARPHRLLPKIVQTIGELHSEGKECLLLVPEQFTLQAEREILTRLKLPGLFYVEVMSPTRLRHRVTEAVGTDERVPLSAAGQQMAVSFALEQCRDRLKFYQASVNRRGFAQKLTALISDMKRGGLEPEALMQYADNLPNGMRKEKLNDLALLYSQYRETLKDKLGDSDDLNLYVTNHLAESGVVAGRHVFSYGFDAMSEQMIVLLCAIGSNCESLTVGLICDTSYAADEALYQPVRQSIARFRMALETHGLDLSETPVPKETLRHAPAISFLDEVLFSYPHRRFEGEQNSVYLSQFLSPFEEATFAAQKILQLNQQGVSLERIAVFYPDQHGYPFAVRAALADSGLPYYTDEKLPAFSHALVCYLMAALRCISDGYKNEDMFVLLKTGYAKIGFDDASFLENYAREFGIDRSRWLTPFKLGDDVVCRYAEALRRDVVQPLVEAREMLVRAKDTAQSLSAVMHLLTSVDAYETLGQEEDALVAENLLVRAGQNSQIWQMILELMDQLMILSNGKRIPLNAIADRFESGFSAISLAALPPAANMLHAGVLGHSLSSDADTVFVLGMNDGILSKSTESLLTENERAETQEETQSFLGMTEDSRLAYAKLDIKSAMTLPKSTLYLSYAKTDPAGNALQPLDLVNDLEEQLFEYLPDAMTADEMLPVSSGQAMSVLSDLLRMYADGDTQPLPDHWKKRLGTLLSSPKTSAQAFRLINAAGFQVESLPLTLETAKVLFGDRALSVSRLEDFAACPFRHFVTYGLLPEERKEWEVTPIERGNFFHASLQRFAQIAVATPQFPNCTIDELKAMTDAAAAPLIDELEKGPMGDGARSLASLAQAQRVIQRACMAVTEHLASGAFRLETAESSFGFSGEESFPPVVLHLPDGTEVSLHGRTDRIDRYDTPDAVYRRVVDYKSGTYASLDASQLWHGLQLQLILYLDAATRNKGDAKPAGAFYFHLFDPLSKADDTQAGAVDVDIQKQLQMDGVALSDTAILDAMDTGETPVSIPSAVTRKGELRKGAKVLDETHLSALMNHTRGKATAFAQGMLKGDITIRPVRQGARESCDYCDYRAICGYDPLARGAENTEIFSMSMEDLAGRLDSESDT